MKNLYELLREAKEKCSAVGIPYGKITNIKLNNRLSKCWGRCLTKNHKEFWIEINGKYASDEFSTNENIVEVICHEIIHTCEGCWNHGYQFMQYGKLLTAAYGIVVSTTDSAENRTIDKIAWETSKKYAVKCNCRTIYKDRMCDIIRYPHIYECNKCKGKFERVK